MKRLLLPALLLAACSKPAPPDPLRSTLKTFTAAFAEYQALGDRLEVSPQDPKVRESLSATTERLKSLMEALSPLADARTRATPDDPVGLEAQWLIAFLHQDDAAMDRELASLAGRKPGDPLVAARRAHRLRRKGRYDEARRIVDPLLERHPEDPNLLFESGAASYNLNEFGGASTRIEAAEANKASLELPSLLEHSTFLRDVRAKTKAWAAEQELRDKEAKADDLPRVRIETSKGPVLVELFENEAPNTVANFIDLVEKQVYDGTKFHRVIEDFMAQGGDPLSKSDPPDDDGSGGPGYEIADELSGDGWRRHFRGSLSMANTGPDSGGSQFFITRRPTAHLDGKHTVFGRVLEGMDVVDAIAAGDLLKRAGILRRRDHAYRPVIKD